MRPVRNPALEGQPEGIRIGRRREPQSFRALPGQSARVPVCGTVLREATVFLVVARALRRETETPLEATIAVSARGRVEDRGIPA